MPFTRFVNTASSGGDGTTNGESGATAAYASLNACEVAERADLVTLADNLIIECSVGSGSAADTTVVNFLVANWTTSPSFNVTVRAAAGEEATAEWDAANYRLSGTANYDGMLDYSIDLIADRLQVENTRNAGRPNGIRCLGACEAELLGCHVRHTGTAAADTFAIGQGAVTGAAITLSIINALVDGFSLSIGPASYNGNASTTLIIYNPTVINSTSEAIDLQQLDGTAATNSRVRNAIADGATTADYNNPQGGSITTTDLMTSDTTSPTSDGSSTFTYASGTDATNASGSAAVGAGTDLSADSDYAFSTDINGVTRTAWDAGCGEFVAAGGGGELLQLSHHLRGGFNSMHGGMAE